MNAKYMRVPTTNPSLDGDVKLNFESAFTYGNKYTLSRQFKSIFSYRGQGGESRVEIFGSEVTSSKQSFASRCCEVFIIIICYALVILTVPFSLLFCLKSVNQYEEVVVFRLGRLQKSKGHGMVFILPCIDKTQRVDLRMRAFSVPPQQVITQDGAIVEVGADVYFRIASVSRSVTTVQDLNYSTRILVQTTLTRLLTQKNLGELDTDKITISQDLQKEANEAAGSWGVEVSRIEIPQVKVLKEANPSRLSQMLFPPGMENSIPPALQQLTQAFMAATAPGQSSGHILPPGATISNKVQFVGTPSGQESIAFSTPADLLSAVRPVLNETLVKQVDAVFEFNVEGDRGGIYYLDLKHNGGDVGEGRPPGGDPDATLTLDVEDMKAIFFKQLNPLQAYMGGRLRVSGDLSAAMKLEDVLKRLKRNHECPT